MTNQNEKPWYRYNDKDNVNFAKGEYKKLDFCIQFDSDNGEIEPKMYRCKPIITSREGLDK